MKKIIPKIALLAAVSVFSGCNTETGPDKPNQRKVEVTFRPDAVEPAVPVDVEYSVGGEIHRVSNVAPGTKINPGSVPVNTQVHFRVYNRLGAGQIRANILTNNCFRKTVKCDSLNCVAEAEYVAIDEDCPNY